MSELIERTMKRRKRARAYKPAGPTPDIETLIRWDWDGGCETVCEHANWVEPDGYCHQCGAPSWLIYMGMI